MGSTNQCGPFDPWFHFQYDIHHGHSVKSILLKKKWSIGIILIKSANKRWLSFKSFYRYAGKYVG